MGYITAREAAEKWGISERRISRLCQDGRIKKAYKPTGGKTCPWLIPDSAQDPRKPDGRPPENKKGRP